MGYREDWFANHKPNMFGKYTCVNCGKKCDKSEIEIDHRIPKRKGGTDDLWNLQPMCRACNRSKGKRNSKLETAGTLVRATLHGDLCKALGGMTSRSLKDAVGLKYKRK